MDYISLMPTASHYSFTKKGLIYMDGLGITAKLNVPKCSDLVQSDHLE